MPTLSLRGHQCMRGVNACQRRPKSRQFRRLKIRQLGAADAQLSFLTPRVLRPWYVGPGFSPGDLSRSPLNCRRRMPGARLETGASVRAEFMEFPSGGPNTGPPGRRRRTILPSWPARQTTRGAGGGSDGTEGDADAVMNLQIGQAIREGWRRRVNRMGVPSHLVAQLEHFQRRHRTLPPQPLRFLRGRHARPVACRKPLQIFARHATHSSGLSGRLPVADRPRFGPHERLLSGARNRWGTTAPPAALWYMMPPSGLYVAPCPTSIIRSSTTSLIVRGRCRMRHG
jgi:hypothetical protein